MVRWTCVRRMKVLRVDSVNAKTIGQVRLTSY